jgi:2-methylcitrate dehydratase PrpD
MSMGTTTDTAPGLSLLARHAGALTLARVPAEVRQQARLCILDTVGCIIAGTGTEEARLILACEPADAAPATSTILGTKEHRPLRAAIRINGFLGDVLELNDLIGGHASIGNVTAALMLAEAEDTSGAGLVEAVVRGIEVTARVYGAVYPTLKRFTEMGIVPVGIPSAIGAAAAASHLLGLGVEQTAHAMAIAGATSGWCPAEVIFGDGGTMKPLLFGAQPALAGITAARDARHGMTGPLRLLESKLGYLATSATAGRLDTSPWDAQWALAQPRRKLHACCGYLHSAVDAVGMLRRRLGAAAQRGRVEVHVPGYTSDAVNKSRPPVSANDARFHLQYCLALVLCGADVIAPEHSIAYEAWLGRDDVAQAMARIRVVVDPGLAHYQQCRIVLLDDERVVGEQVLDAPRGSPSDPLSDAEVVAKFVRLAGPVIGHEQAERVASGIDGLEELGSVVQWIRGLAR